MLILEKWTEPRKSNGTRSYCNAQCECGDISRYNYDNISTGNTIRCKSCANKSRAEKHTKHGKTGLSKNQGGKAYYTWSAMKRRCNNPKESRYEKYGGRGIKVCQRWSDSFESFIADMGEPPSGKHSIERINNDGNYEPGNCKWASATEQGNNKSNNALITVNGETKTLQQWANLTGIKSPTIRKRLKSGWKPEDAIKPETMKFQTPEGKFASLSKAAEHFGMSISGVHARIKSENYPDWFKIKVDL